ncbi:MAG TPA: MarR family winged helix-turn-helix transcriptional regulator [Steroidobacteraceae bacterium]|nr:MarR family winged helix-turn-helix transcriptional regulator [Steroidobacteraceae bacterium]
MGNFYQVRSVAGLHRARSAQNESARRSTGRRRNTLALEVLKQFRLIYGSVRHHFRRIEAACGVSGSQLWLLQEIERTPGVGVSVLARRLLIHQTTCSQLIEKLVTRGYVHKERSRQDQRRVGLTVSKGALGVLAKAPGPAEGVLPEALAELPDAALRSLSVQLHRLIAELHLRDGRSAGKPLSDL